MFSPNAKRQKAALEGLDANIREKVPDNAKTFVRKY